MGNVRTDISDKSSRIAKNTAALYFRMIFLMLIGLFTSRVILRNLGIVDYGIYNAVGGFVAMFSVISASLSSAISRFITYEMERPESRQSAVFSSSLSTLILIAAVIVVLAETVGLWWLHSKMVIPDSRMAVTGWVFQLSLVSFVIQLVSVPYNASIIAHEKMDAFAYIGIVEGLLKLAVALAIAFSSFDKLIFFAVLMCLVSLIVRFLYGYYCRLHFSETKYTWSFDRGIFKEIFAFAGWNFIGSGALILRDQGGNQLLNIFFGPVANAAWGVAAQVNNMVQKFVTSFTTALNPQIIKSYATGDRDYMDKLVFKGSKISLFLLLVVACPLIYNADFLTRLWLGADVVPDNSVLFIRLVLVCSLVDSVSFPLITALNATGNIRNYQLLVGGMLLMNLPIDYILLKSGAPGYVIYVVAIAIAFFCLAGRLYELRKLMGFNVGSFMKTTLSTEFLVALLSFSLPYVLSRLMPLDVWWGFIVHAVFSVIWTSMCVLFVGFTKSERNQVTAKLFRR